MKVRGERLQETGGQVGFKSTSRTQSRCQLAQGNKNHWNIVQKLLKEGLSVHIWEALSVKLAEPTRT